MSSFPFRARYHFFPFSQTRSPFLVSAVSVPAETFKNCRWYFVSCLNVRFLLLFTSKMTDFRFKEKLSVSGVEMPRENELSIGFPAPASRRAAVLSFPHGPSKVILMHYWPDLSHFSSSAALIEKWLSHWTDSEGWWDLSTRFSPRRCVKQLRVAAQRVKLMMPHHPGVR